MAISTDHTPEGNVAHTVAQLRAAGCVFAEAEATLLLAAATDSADRDRLVERRVRGEPLEQILGWVSFDGLRIAIDPGVFVPRRRTELLVTTAARCATAGVNARPPVIVDLCCGSGAVGAALLTRLSPITLYATDLDPVAVQCARRNIAHEAGTVLEGDLYDALPSNLRGHVDLIVCNAPYVPTDEIATMPPEARDHEPTIALDGGPDGNTIHRRVAAAAPGWLRPGGHLLIETSDSQADETLAALNNHGFATELVTDPEIGATVAIGRADRQLDQPV